ncbi:Crp/Fnr family transcriptional regulator, partial [candidate division CSSED10-310 bacterium]
VKSDYKLAAEKAIRFAQKRAQDVDPQADEKGIKKVVDQCIENGYISADLKAKLEKRFDMSTVYDPHAFQHLVRLQHLIDSGVVRTEYTDYSNLLHQVTEQQLMWIKKHFTLKIFPPGTTIYSQGDETGYALLILDGKIKEQMEIDGVARTIASVFKGELSGEMGWLIGRKKRDTTAIAIDEVQALVIDQHGIRKLLQRNRRLAARIFYNLVSLLSDRLEELNIELFKLYD